MKGNKVSAVRSSRALRILLIAVLCAVAGAIPIRWIWFRPAERDTLSQVQTEREVTILLDKAERASDAGDLGTASRLFEDALRLEPDNNKALVYSAGLRQQSGDLATAKELLSKVGDTPSNFGATARYLEGTIALAEHKARLAESSYLKARRLNPSYQPPLRELARLYALQLRGPELTQVLRELERLRALNIEELVMQLLAGRPFVERSQAMLLLKQLTVHDPEDIHSVLAQARYMLLEGDPHAAAAQIAEIKGPTSHDPAVLTMLALVCELNATGLANDQPEFKLTFSSTTTEEAWELASRRASVVGDWETVKKIESYLLTLKPFSPTVSHSLAVALDRMDKPEQAKLQHQQTEKLDQLEILAYRMLNPRARVPDVGIPVICEIVDLLKDSGHSGEAVSWLTVAESLEPGRPDVRSRIQLLSYPPGNAKQLDSATAPILPTIVLRPHDRASSSQVKHSVTEFKFRDVAADMGIQFEYCNGQSQYKRILETIGGGSAVLDIDGDLWPDLYFPQGKHFLSSSPPLNDALYRNHRGLRFSECTQSAGINEYEHSLSATVADFDNDGFADVFVTNVGACRLFHNNGDGTFINVTPTSIVRNLDCSSCACFADLNQDGLLDLFVVNYVADWDRRCLNNAGEFATCHPHELQRAQNRLYQNLGNGEFSDITESSGLLGISGRGLGVLAADLDNDGQTDIFVANDGTPNMLFAGERSPGEAPFAKSPTADAGISESRDSASVSAVIRLTDIAAQCGVAVPADGRSHAGMGIAVSDFDENGTLDLFVTNFFREQNTLYSGIGSSLFMDKSQESGLGSPSMELLGFGTQAIDINSDGHDDIVILNGDIDDYSSTGRRWKMPSSVFRNDGDGRFIDMSNQCGAEMQLPQLGRGLSRIDFDGDQVLDLVAVRHDGPIRLLKNETLPENPCINLRFVSHRECRDAIGRQIRMTHGENHLMRIVASGDGFSASNERLLSFAIPSRAEIQIDLGLAQLNLTGIPMHLKSVAVVEQVDGAATFWQLPN